MKRSLILLAFIASCFTIYAEKLTSKYVSRLVSDGMLYFIGPFELPNQQKGQPVEMDITYITKSDSLTFNMSIYTSVIIQTDSIKFVSNTPKTITDFTLFFIDKKGKNFIHRYSCKLPYSYFEELYTEANPFVVEVYTDKGQVLQYAYNAKKWSKECSWMQQIIQIIKSN